MKAFRLIVFLLLGTALLLAARVALARCAAASECAPMAQPTRTLAPLWTPTPSPTATPTATTPPAGDSRNCNPDTGWWDKPVEPMYAIAAILDHERGGYDYCPPPGSEWERWLTVPGYFQTQTPAAP
jgi:hypothetical protein